MSFAAAIACQIVLQRNESLEISIPQAVERACKYVEAGINSSSGFGHGSGPINHFHWLSIQNKHPRSSSLRKYTIERQTDDLSTERKCAHDK